MKKIFLAGLILVFAVSANSQKASYKSAIISFYNLENLFDTIDNPLVNDQEFLPSGIRNYNTSIYFDKIGKLSKVISEIGVEVNPDGPAILGVSEIENDTVLADLINHDLLRKRNYKIVHYDSKDFRGVDVGMLYNPKYFRVDTSDKLFVQLPGGSKDAYYTRDVLYVKGRLDGDLMHIYVNHWPSRSGGEARSAPAREAAARVCRAHMDSILKFEPNAKFIVMGDLNDDPINASVAKVLGAKSKEKDVKKGELFNPWHTMYRKGLGTLAYQDAWGLFDQIIVSHAFLPKNQDGFFLYQSHIFRREYLVENRGQYKGYPMRTWDGNTYRGGYSDHFPTYLILLKKLVN